MGSKRVAVIADLHTGHYSGATHPDYWDLIKPKFRESHKERWEWITRILRELGRIDILLVNGDAIDGAGDRSGMAAIPPLPANTSGICFGPSMANRQRRTLSSALTSITLPIAAGTDGLR